MKQEISSFWYTPKGYKGIGLMELLSIKSFIDNGYKFILYTYNLDDKIFRKLDELFDDFELKDANEIVPFENYFSDDRGAGVAAFSDYFRYYMLYQKDAIWVDLDMICLNYIDLNEKYIFSQELDIQADKSEKYLITTSFLKFPKKSNFGENLIHEAEKIINKRKQIPWGVIGPWFLADQVKKWGLENFAWDYKKTCQLYYGFVEKLIYNKQIFDEQQPFIHLFSEMWRVNNLNKNYFYKYGFYRKLLERYDIKSLSKQLNLDYSDDEKIYKSLLFKKRIKYIICQPKKFLQGYFF